MPNGALAGIKVLELGEGVSAPFCAKLFADYGAEVVKVESPSGDVARRWGPFPGDQADLEASGLFFFLNTNKKSVCLDLDRPRDRNHLERLLEWADLIVENLPPGRVQQWQLDYGQIARTNPRAVVVSLSPFGRTGPLAAWHGCDLNAYHFSAAGTRYCGRPDREPLELGTFAADFFAAYTAAAWGLAALLERERSGRGQHVDVAACECIAALFVGCQNIGAYAQDGTFERRTGVGMALGAPATILPARDGHVWMIALERAQWEGLVRAMGSPDWAQAELFGDMFERARNADLIYSLLEQWTREHSKHEIMQWCQERGCPTTALLTVEEIANHEHLKQRGYLVELEHPRLGRIRTLGAPIRLPECPGGPAHRAPVLGEDTEQVIAQLAAPPVQAESAAEPNAGDGNETYLPLEGVRVANFGWGWLGPVVGQTLGFLGAEVYKIESRARLDINRTLPPFAGGERDPNRSLQNHAAWAGNGSVTINLKKPEGQALARELVAHCDVAIENFGPGVMEKLHLSYRELRAVRPDLVLVSLPPAGLSGPLSRIRTYGMSLSSITGLDSLTGYPDGDPVPMENAFADPLGGIVGAFAALIALRYRRRTGQGQHVDCSQQEALAQLIAPAFMDYVLNGRVAGPRGNRHPCDAAVPHGVFPCAGEDRWITIAVFDDQQWQGLVEEMGRPGWATGLATLEQRRARVGEIEKKIGEWTSHFDRYELARRLQARGVCAAPVLAVPDLLEDEHYRARGTFVEVTHPLGFRETIYGAYVKMSRTRPRIEPGPAIGRDNEKVFRGLLGLSAERYRKLVEDQVIY